MIKCWLTIFNNIPLLRQNLINNIAYFLVFIAEKDRTSIRSSCCNPRSDVATSLTFIPQCPQYEEKKHETFSRWVCWNGQHLNSEYFTLNKRTHRGLLLLPSYLRDLNWNTIIQKDQCGSEHCRSELQVEAGKTFKQKRWWTTIWSSYENCNVNIISFRCYSELPCSHYLLFVHYQLLKSVCRCHRIAAELCTRKIMSTSDWNFLIS